MMLRWICLTTVMIVALAGNAPAQDAHYWNRQYGNRAYMLGGAVIGSSDDVSAVYYNPALLTVADKPNLTVSGNAFYSTSITLRNALGDEVDLSSSSIGSVPSFVAGEIPLGDGNQQRLAYSLLFRQDYEFILERRGPISLAGLPPDAQTRVSLEESGHDIWSGFSYARSLDGALSIGASVYLSYRTQRSRSGILLAADTDEEFGVVAVRNDFDYTQISLVAKAGVGGRSGNWRYGLNVTVPSLRITGSGSKSFDRVLAAGATDGSQVSAVVQSDFQTDLRSNHKTPFAAGAGLAYRIDRTTVHVAAEWYAEVKPYDLLDSQRVLDEDTGLPIDESLVTSSRSVVNLGVGLEHEFGDRVHGYLGFHSDRSAAGDDNLGSQLAIWDIYHASGGVSLGFGDKRIALGAVYAFGNEPLPGAVPVGSDDPASLPQKIEAEYRSFLLLLGFDVNY